MTTNQKIVEAAWAGLKRGYWLPQKGGQCLVLARVVIEKALDLPERYLYRHWVRERVETNFDPATRDPIARDAERSLFNLGWAVPFDDRQAGDVVFDWTAAYRKDWGTSLGHVGVLLEAGGQEFVLENTEHPTRGLRRYETIDGKLAIGAVALTPLSLFCPSNPQNPSGKPTRVIRILKGRP